MAPILTRSAVHRKRGEFRTFAKQRTPNLEPSRVRRLGLRRAALASSQMVLSMSFVCSLCLPTRAQNLAQIEQHWGRTHQPRAAMIVGQRRRAASLPAQSRKASRFAAGMQQSMLPDFHRPLEVPVTHPGWERMGGPGPWSAKGAWSTEVASHPADGGRMSGGGDGPMSRSAGPMSCPAIASILSPYVHF